MRFRSGCLACVLVLLPVAAPSSGQDTDTAPDARPVLEACEIGAIPNLHRFGRIFLAGQPSLADFGAAQELENVRTVINLRTESEMTDSGQEATLKRLKIEYHHLPFAAPETLTDEVFDATRKLVSDRKNLPLILHCKSANRVGAIWLVHRVLDGQQSYEQALAEAKQVGLRFAPYEQKAKAYIDRELAKQRQRADRLSKPVLRVVFFTPSDIEPPDGVRDRLREYVDYSQSFFAKWMKHWEYECDSPLAVNRDADGAPEILFVKGRHTEASGRYRQLGFQGEVVEAACRKYKLDRTGQVWWIFTYKGPQSRGFRGGGNAQRGGDVDIHL